MTKTFDPNAYSNLYDYLCNLRYHEYDNGYKPKHQILYDYMDFSDGEKDEFKKEYFHPDAYYAIKQQEWGYLLEKPVWEVYQFPFLKESLCTMFIEEAVNFNHFLGPSFGSNREDFYPTTDVRLASLPDIRKDKDASPLNDMYTEWLRDCIGPIVWHIWKFSVDTYQWTFMAKYHPDDQPNLGLHHDRAVCASILQLNNNYKGGGTFFEKQGVVLERDTGWVTLHPSRLTHRHSGRAVTEGTRYILVTFID